MDGLGGMRRNVPGVIGSISVTFLILAVFTLGTNARRSMQVAMTIILVRGTWYGRSVLSAHKLKFVYQYPNVVQNFTQVI